MTEIARAEINSEMTPEEREAYLDSPMSAALPMYDPATGRLLKTMRQYVESLRNPRHVAQSVIRWKKAELYVSTVHLVSDHNWGRLWAGADLDMGTNAPIVYETMVFGSSEKFDALTGAEEYESIGALQVRYPTAEEARQGHEQVCRLITRVLIGKQFTVVRHNPPTGLADVVDPIVEPVEQAPSPLEVTS